MFFGIRDPRSEMGKNPDPGSGINIPDPQHCIRNKHPTSYKISFSYVFQFNFVCTTWASEEQLNVCE